MCSLRSLLLLEFIVQSFRAITGLYNHFPPTILLKFHSEWSNQTTNICSLEVGHILKCLHYYLILFLEWLSDVIRIQ